MCVQFPNRVEDFGGARDHRDEQPIAATPPGAGLNWVTPQMPVHLIGEGHDGIS